MSSSIWTRCAGASEVRPLAARPWRAVEAQHIVSTRKLVETDDEQRVLEELLEESKPPLPPEAERRGLHFLLQAPFRYPPLRHGSRFSTRLERGLWYGARERRTALAEVAYYRLLFLEGTRAPLERVHAELTAYRVPVRTRAGIDLCGPAFASERDAIASPVSYRASQALGAAMRAAGVEAFRYPSARDPRGGVGVALFTPRAFAAVAPSEWQAWSADATRSQVRFVRRDSVMPERMEFERAAFEVDGRLPAPAP